MTQTVNLDQMVPLFIQDIVPEIDALCADPRREPRRLEQLLAIGLRIYGGTGSDELIPFLSQAYRLAVSKLQPQSRLHMWQFLNQGISRGEMRHDVMAPIVMWEPEDHIVSAASLDLVAFSSLGDDGIPAGLRAIWEHLDHGVINPGAVVGGLILLGDRNLMPGIAPLRRHLSSKQALAAAARCRSNRLFHASVDFWLDWAEELVGRTDPAGEEAFSLCATALVNLRTAASSDALVIDAYRTYPSHLGGSIHPVHEWTLSSYSDHIAPRLFRLEAAERAPKVMDQVIIAWGLHPRSDPSDRAFDRRGQKHN
jgi:hypothetical protein